MKYIHLLCFIILLQLSCSEMKSDSIVVTDDPIFTETHPADWLQGSWGVTFPVQGGERLDDVVTEGFDLLSGAQEIVDELPLSGHVITNLSYFAHSHYFTLRGNTNVNVASEIHESLVPSLENEKIILGVLEKFHNSGKKNILYISTSYMQRASDEVKAAWIDYYTKEFEGDQYLAYENLIEGFIERVKDYTDGYWLDTTSSLSNDGKLEAFIDMIKSTDPGAAVTANSQKKYFTNENNEFIYVDSDGVNDTNHTDYKVILHEPLNDLQDFTHGHVTPIGQGAPPNSFAYEEFTIPNMVASPWYEFEGKSVLKHAWFPIRERWHVPHLDLVFGLEQAYRFVKRIKDSGSAITFANTTDNGVVNPGHMMADEMVIMKEINDRLLMDVIPDFDPYIRPEGASLVNE